MSDRKLAEVGDELAKRHLASDEFYLSVIPHFQILWGYLSARLSPARYERLLEVAEMRISPQTKLDAEEAAAMKPNKNSHLRQYPPASARFSLPTTYLPTRG